MEGWLFIGLFGLVILFSGMCSHDMAKRDLGPCLRSVYNYRWQIPLGSFLVAAACTGALFHWMLGH